MELSHRGFDAARDVIISFDPDDAGGACAEVFAELERAPGFRPLVTTRGCIDRMHRAHGRVPEGSYLSGRTFMLDDRLVIEERARLSRGVVAVVDEARRAGRIERYVLHSPATDGAPLVVDVIPTDDRLHLFDAVPMLESFGVCVCAIDIDGCSMFRVVREPHRFNQSSALRYLCSVLDIPGANVVHFGSSACGSDAWPPIETSLAAVWKVEIEEHTLSEAVRTLVRALRPLKDAARPVAQRARFGMWRV